MYVEPLIIAMLMYPAWLSGVVGGWSIYASMVAVLGSISFALVGGRGYTHPFNPDMTLYNCNQFERYMRQASPVIMLIAFAFAYLSALSQQTLSTGIKLILGLASLF